MTSTGLFFSTEPCVRVWLEVASKGTGAQGTRTWPYRQPNVAHECEPVPFVLLPRYNG